ncbi:MAG TPA: hypothetical protein VI913_03730, partial [Candidatus Peribacteraceae bacterium]|nr:hypothetical protein [Candidatus Peribacteraceae bacterium]
MATQALRSDSGQAFAPEKEYKLELGDKPLTIRTGRIGNQADASVLAQLGETVAMEERKRNNPLPS